MEAIVKISILSLICCMLFSMPDALAQSAEKTETFKVYGNCNTCKRTIEESLKKKDGVLKKEWSPETKMLVVTYDTTKITLHQVKQKIADAGYDTDEVRATDEAYKELHKCCQYDRPKK